MNRALITGGTSGIGAAFARSLAKRGVPLVLVARDKTRLEQVANELRNLGAPEVEVLPADLSQDTEMWAVVDRLTATEKPIDMLVANAGFSAKAPLVTADREDFAHHDDALQVMVRSVYVLCGAAAAAMKESGQPGWIITTASTVAHVTQNNYSAIKAWVLNYSESLAVQLRGTKVQVTALCPGWVRTEFHSRAGIKGSSIPGFMWMDADRIAEDCLRDAARGKVVSIPGKRYQFLIGLLRHAPRRAVYWVSNALSARRGRE